MDNPHTRHNQSFQELMDLFKEKNYWQRLRMMFIGLRKSRESGAYKQAHTELQRQMAPLAALGLPIICMILLALLVRAKPQIERSMTVVALPPESHPTPLVDLPPPETWLPVAFDPSPGSLGMPNASANPATPETTATDSAHEATPAPLPLVYSPVQLVGVFGGPRGGAEREKALIEFDGNQTTEAAVIRALRWLKKNQQADGSWLRNKTAMTALATLCFLAHDEKPGKSAEFGDTVQRGIEYLLASQPASGQWKGSYEHYIATYALCEAYGMTLNPSVQAAADLAVKHIIEGQHTSGGWDYALKPGERDDTSVMGWAAQALKAAMMADFYSDPEALLRASKLAVKGFRNNASPDGGFGYTGPGRGGLSSVGTLCMQFHHANNFPEVKNSLELMNAWKPIWVGSRPGFRLARDEKPANASAPGVAPGGSTQYYYYYATQAKFQAGGSEWKRWNTQMWPEYVKAQFVEEKAIADPKGVMQDIGWWENADVHTDRPVMDTCLAALQLMVYYRYLPTFQVIDTPSEIVATAQDRADIKVDISL